jgi:hypothetical protein
MAKRGFVPEDGEQFTGKQLGLLQKAADEVQFLLDQGYDVKPVTTFVGNHYMFSERQRLALARSVSSKEWIGKRSGKELLKQGNLIKTARIDGFNTIITLEVALSGSPILYCRDGAVRDLAGLRGTYRVIDKTQKAIELILGQLKILKIPESVFYLDAPVSNSGRLSTFIRQCAEDIGSHVQVQVIPDVDRMLEQMEGVISGDAIILNHCISWINIMPRILDQLGQIWKIQL